jgi:hypothetical protein
MAQKKWGSTVTPNGLVHIIHKQTINHGGYNIFADLNSVQIFGTEFTSEGDSPRMSENIISAMHTVKFMNNMG